MGKKVLVAYGSKYGATGEIAEKIGETLREAGLTVDVAPVGQVGDISTYDAFVVGSGVYIGMWRRDAAKFVLKNEETLAGKPVWIFSSGPTGKEEEGAFMDDGNLPKKLRDVAARIKPRGIVIFKGAIESARLSGLERWMIKRVEESKDSSGLGDFREWDVITSWAKNIAAALGG